MEKGGAKISYVCISLKTSNVFQSSFSNEMQILINKKQHTGLFLQKSKAKLWVRDIHFRCNNL